MAVGDEFGLSEDLYQKLIGRYVSAVEVLTQRITAKDQHIAKLETQQALTEAKSVEPAEGDVMYVAPGDEPPTAAPKGKRK
jgi:hypothetical protein